MVNHGINFEKKVYKCLKSCQPVVFHLLMEVYQVVNSTRNSLHMSFFGNQKTKQIHEENHQEIACLQLLTG